MTLTLRHSGIVIAAALAASLLSAPPVLAADAAPKVYARTPHYLAGGIAPVTFEPGQNENLSAVTSLTLFADGKEIGTDTTAPWGIDWDTTGFDGSVILSTRATTATGSRTTNGFPVWVDNQAPTGLTVRFPSLDGYIGQDGVLAVDAEDNVYALTSELVVGDQVVSSKDLTGGGTLDLPWNIKLPNGRTTMTVRVRDKVGNATALTRTVVVDNDRPVITGTTTAGSTVRGPFTVSLSTYRDASPFVSFEASLDTPAELRSYGQENSRTVTIDSRELPDGKYTLGWHAWDGAGNEAVIKRSLIVDNRAPTVSITKAPKNRAKLTKTVTITASAADRNGIAKVQLLVNGKIVATDYRAGYAFTLNPKKYGKTFTVQLRAYDRAGNVTVGSKLTYRR
ncbi:Ig-like domain-containing protein [Actinoplanes sp. NPDC020271]|uniref:Ig-like domain-containing protein n=1 Tax=Actinoplanes sp. NPDC020271 TaxID=3363896 RepID=UPI0037B4941B